MNGAASIPLFECFFSKLQENDIPVNFISQGTSQACINYAKKRGYIYYLSSLDVSSISSESGTKNILLAPTDGVFVTYYASWLSNNHRPEIDSFIHWCNILI